MRKFIITLTIFLGIGNVCACEIPEEEALLMRRKQDVTQFQNNKEIIFQELNEIEKLRGLDQIKRLRKFGYDTLNHRRSIVTIGSMMGIFYTLSDDLLSAHENYCSEKVIQLIRGKLEEDFQECGAMLGKTVLSEGKFPSDEHWNYEKKFQSTDLIKITHGGGLCYLLDCFEGKEIGYRLERGGLGIQVHPSHGEYENGMDRSPTYAYHAMTKALDFPAVFTGYVQAQYLMSADNSYEAAIKVAHLRHVQNATLTLVTDDMIEEPLYWGHTGRFCKLMPQELKDRLEKFNNKIL